uniref:THO complex 1 n=1 Tax=Hucho hucho TaxID=62062 RepID=A0A4W5QDU6_9TELE
LVNDFLSLIYLSIDGCDKVFSFVEDNNSFYTVGKNYLLRMCNDLLRRLSKSQNIVFCGRIQLFLALIFPLSEKSGLNLQSQFNPDNITVFNKNEQASTLGQKVRWEMRNLYRKFWTLQDFFRNPVQCYEKFSCMTFLKYSDETLAVKLEERRTAGGDHVYFAKFLTSEKLMDLQLSDSNFRRHILLQYLILFKSSSCILNDDQCSWMEETTKVVYQVCVEFMPTLEEFFEEAIEQADPANMVEDEYKYVYTLTLRLLSRRSPHFFQPTNQQFKSLADYLESMAIKLAKELPKDLLSEEIKTGEEDYEDNGDTLLKESNDSLSMQTKLVSNQQMDYIAAKLGAQWKTLADKDVDMQAKLLLVAWQDHEGTQATVESLVPALNDAGFPKIADILNET